MNSLSKPRTPQSRSSRRSHLAKAGTTPLGSHGAMQLHCAMMLQRQCRMTNPAGFAHSITVSRAGKRVPPYTVHELP